MGSGKSSLLKVLADVQAPEGGHIQRGFNAQVGYLDQEVHGLSTGRRVKQELSAAAGGLDEDRLEAITGALGFGADMLQSKVEDLSVAEQSLLANTLLILGEHTVLLLDEPTQHLDCASSEMLAGALEDYPGTVVVVSNDRYFLDRVARRILSIEGRALVDVEGRYSELGVLAETDPAKEGKPERSGGKTKVDAKKLQQRIDELLERMSDPSMALDWEGLEALSAEKKELQDQLKALQRN